MILIKFMLIIEWYVFYEKYFSALCHRLFFTFKLF